MSHDYDVRTLASFYFKSFLLQNTKLNQHLFWVAVGILQLGEATLYAAGLGLMEACIKILTNIEAFEEQVRERERERERQSESESQ